jgi:hypothetical protein
MSLEKIKCFYLKDTGREFVASGAKLRIYSDGLRDYHLGNADAIADDGEILRCAPVGAMWNADWFIGCREENGLVYSRHGDGIVLCVRCPGGDWLVDGPSDTGGAWERSGTVPNVTVTPSILQRGKYHGWLRDGYLEEC